MAFLGSPRPPFALSLQTCSLSPSHPYQLQHNCQLLVVLLDLNSYNHTPTMRYDDWDVILFPKDSHVPIQEFKTACFVSQADCELCCFSVHLELNYTNMSQTGAHYLR